MDAILATHRIDAAKLRADDFPGFMAARAEALLQVIESAIGKPVQRAGGDFADTETADASDEEE